jgi:type I restriction enzyme S subunit
MLKEKMLVPQLRFSEFEEQWIMEEFRKIANKRKKRFNPKESDKNFPCIELECLSQETGILLKKFDSKYQKSIKNIFSKEDILFGKLRPYLRKFLKPDFDGVCSSEIWVLNGKKVINDYLYFLIQTDRFNYQVNQTSGSKMPRADWDYISQIKFNYPQSKEQQKIANFLTAIDNRIQTLEKKKTLLEQYKKGVMQEVFKQELRFKDDTSTSLTTSDGKAFPEWEFKNGNLLFKSISDKNHNSDLPILAVTQDQGAIPRHLIDYNIGVTTKSVSSYKVVQMGDFIISLRSFQGGIEYSNYKGICSPAYIILKPIKEMDKTFYKYYLKTPNYIQELTRKLEGIRDGKMVSYKYFSEIKLPYPSIEEQTKIANFLSAIDISVELVTKKIEHTKTYKKGLLQQMFV